MKKYLVADHIEAFPYEETKLSIYNRDTGKTFALGQKESKVFKAINGVNTLEDIQKQCSFYSLEEVEKLITAFSQLGFFEKKKKMFNPFKIKLRLFNPNRIFSEKGFFTKFFHYAIFIGAPIAFLLSIFLMPFLKENPLGYMEGSVNALFYMKPFDVGIIIFLSLICLALHEIGHTVSARYFGVNVTEIGVMLYFLIPCAYTNITGINLLESKEKRLAVLISGTLVNVGILGVLWLTMALCPSYCVGAYCLALITVNLGTIFMNTMIFIKFDGYYMLETILDEPKLRENAMGYTVNLIKSIFLKKGSAKTLLNDSLKLENVAYCVYAILSVTYVPFILLNTIIPFIF